MAATQTITIPAPVDLTGFAQPKADGTPPMLTFPQFVEDFCIPRMFTKNMDALKAIRELNEGLADATEGQSVPLTNAAHSALKESLPRLLSELPQSHAHLAINQRLFLRILSFYDAVHAATAS